MSPTLEDALEEAIRYRWHGMRSCRSHRCQTLRGIATLQELFNRMGAAELKGGPLSSHMPSLKLVGHFTVGRFEFPTWIGGASPLPSSKCQPHNLRVDQVTRELLRQAVRVWQAEGTKASTIGTRLNCLSVLGVDVTGCRPRLPNSLKWWLTPQAEEKLLTWLRASRDSDLQTLADYVIWATRTGCRIEETLALQWSDIHQREFLVKRPDGSSQAVLKSLVTVPGLKTLGSQATLIIASEAAEVLVRREAAGELKPFNITYRALREAWTEARDFLGEGVVPYKATLKALRRNAARSLHATKGMPLDMVRQYLRHGSVKTTMGYLRLTGGYGENEMAQWL